MITRRVIAPALLIAGSLGLRAQSAESILGEKIEGLRALADSARPDETRSLASEVCGLPAGTTKVRLADALAKLSTEGDPGRETLQAVADALAQSLNESPQPPESESTPATAYMDLARLVRYEGVKVDSLNPMLTQAAVILAMNDADVAKADFTLMDTQGRRYTLSELQGKIVLVNFWATWCPPCRKEMRDLDEIYSLYKARGLVVLSITSEGPEPVISFLSSARYRPPVLIDEDGKVTKEFHVDGLPRTFLFDRRGKLVSEAIDMRTRQQFFDMLAFAGLKSYAPQRTTHRGHNGVK